MSSPSVAEVLFVRTAFNAATADGEEALPNETGGVLLGFRTPTAIIVTRIVTVPDARSTRRSYLRRQRPAQELMTAVHKTAPAVVGYVGEWHTHPEDQEPSKVDLRSIRESARAATGPIALLVLSYPATGPARMHVRFAVRRHMVPIAAIDPIDVLTPDITITDDSADNLEAEAATTHAGGNA